MQRFCEQESLTILVPIATDCYPHERMDAHHQICYNPAHSRPVI